MTATRKEDRHLGDKDRRAELWGHFFHLVCDVLLNNLWKHGVPALAEHFDYNGQS
jgi:hypothetical protein